MHTGRDDMIHRMVATTTLALLMSATALAQGDAVKTDAALNSSYQSLLSNLDGAGQQRLREAQRAWLLFRDKECAFRSSGSVEPGIAGVCLADLTRQRIVELDQERDRLAADAGVSGGSDVPCKRSVDKAVADTLVRQCMQVSPATHPPCNADNPCELIRDEIKRGCAMIDKEDAPAFCSGFRT